MKIVEVVPLDSGIFQHNLSYFTAKEINPGALVEVFLRHKRITALVLKIMTVASVKTRLRTENYALKKIERIRSGGFFLPEFVRAAKRTADYYVGYWGEVISELTPQTIIDRLEQLDDYPKWPLDAENWNLGKEEKTPDEKKNKTEILVLQQGEEDRFSFYRSLVRENFARGRSVFIVAPTITQVLKLKTSLERGIRDYLFCFYGGLAAGKMLTGWKAVLSSPHPVLIIGTPLFFSLPRADLGTIVVEEENNEIYKKIKRPFLDVRYFAEYLADGLGAKIILADTVLRTETRHRLEIGQALAAVPLKQRVFSGNQSLVVGVDRESEKRPLIINPKLTREIAESLADKEKIFIFTARRGLAPIIICHDCGRLVACLRCVRPVILKEKTFFCRHCEESRPAAEYCGYCGSWHLVPLGVGIDRVVEEMKNILPDTSILQIDSDHAPTKKALEGTIRQFYENGGLLVGTEMAVPYLTEKIDRAIVASLDSLLALPEFRITEKIFNLLIKLRFGATKKFIIQTRNPDWPLFQIAANGNLAEFYRQEIILREEFKYPPFKLLIKISRQGPREEVLEDLRRLENELDDYRPDIFEAFVSRAKNHYMAHALIKLKPGIWPEQKLLDKLRSLSPVFRVEVDPWGLFSL